MKELFFKKLLLGVLTLFAFVKFEFDGDFLISYFVTLFWCLIDLFSSLYY